MSDGGARGIFDLAISRYTKSVESKLAKGVGYMDSTQAARIRAILEEARLAMRVRVLAYQMDAWRNAEAAVSALKLEANVLRPILADVNALKPVAATALDPALDAASEAVYRSEEPDWYRLQKDAVKNAMSSPYHVEA
eukprot:573159_1